MKKPIILILFVLLADQILKIWVKLNFQLGDEIVVFPNWFILHFTENNGMAFGMELAGSAGKLMLSLFRVVAISMLGYYLYWLHKNKAHNGYIMSVALVLAGATGNIIDSTFYGAMFSDSYMQKAAFMPADGGYAPLLFGKVVDMLYFPIIETHFPTWFPLWGGEEFLFFRPVFNLADFSISCGVGLIIFNQGKYFKDHHKLGSPEPVAANDTNSEAGPA